MAKICFTVCGLTLAVALLHPQAFGQSWTSPRPDLAPSFDGSNLACRETPKESVILVPQELVAQAKVKAQLLHLLRESLYDDAKGIVNIAREKEIKKLASKLEHHRD